MNFIKIIGSASLLILLAFNLSAQEAAGCNKKPGDSCPSISVTGPSSGVRSGDSMMFTADVTNTDKIEITSYNWAVTAGSITSGQGTPVITIDTKGLEETTVVTATVSIEGNFSGQCAKQASEAGFIYLEPKARLIDESSGVACEDLLSRTYDFFTHLNNHPTSQGYILIYGLPRAVRRSERIIRNLIKATKYDSSRVTFINGGGGGKRATIEMWLVPPGATSPLPKVPDEEKPDAEFPQEAVDTAKPYIFGSKSVDGVPECLDEFYDLEGYAETIKEKSKNRGNVVIYETSQKLFRQTEKEVLGELAKSGVARKRIKTFFVKVKPAQLREGIQLWLLP